MFQKQPNRNHTHNIHHTRNPYRNIGTPFSAQNEPQVASFPIAAPASTTSQSQSDPFEFESPGAIPYWDDSNGVLYEVPSILPRHPGGTYAETVRRGVYMPHVDETRAEPERVGPVPWSAPPRKRTHIIGNSEIRKRDFLPLLDSTDARYANAASQKTSDNQTSPSHLVLATKDVNQKLRQETEEKIQIATSRRDAWKKESRPSISHQVKFQQEPMLEVEQEGVFEIPQTRAKEARPMTILTEVPTHLQIFKKRNVRPISDRSPSSPTLERVRKLREVEHKAMSAEREKGLKSEQATEPTENDHKARVIMNNHARSQSKASGDNLFLGKVREFIPDMGLSDPDSATLSYDMVHAPPVPPKSADQNPELDPRRKSMSAKFHSVGNSADGDGEKVDALVKAMAEMHVFQELPSMASNNSPLQRQSAVPEGLNLEKIQAARDHPRENSMPIHDRNSEDRRLRQKKEGKTDG